MTPFNNVSRRCLEPLGGQFGSDKAKRLVVTLLPARSGSPDMIAIRPERTQRPVQIAVTDLYRLLLRSEAARATLERARAAKARKAERRERQRIDRQEKAFRKKLKEGRH